MVGLVWTPAMTLMAWWSLTCLSLLKWRQREVVWDALAQSASSIFETLLFYSEISFPSLSENVAAFCFLLSSSFFVLFWIIEFLKRGQ
jgi:hypothetical protein